ncbi:phosphatase PAP2 family protein [Mycobacterium syngnathidarum]|uniref:phosphatase PAP2 family protein n=1 Tax=Mycobacterium syngnathidarum TaxID=1908205 RepID=UPI000959B506|nr:phosphatase PAP2 family protein [Mycobacterium syngnathidarum]OLT94207.1 PA-phosphatase [Mycobacterium syngnathidarum]
MTARWWPPIGLAAMVLLGWAVHGAPLPVDDWFQALGTDMGPRRAIFLLFTKPPLVAAALLIGIVVAVRQHRKRLAVAMVVSPILAITVVRLIKPVFGREKEGALAYPSGHTTFLVTVTGLLVLVAGLRLWALAVAVCVVLLGTFGLSMTFHYFTDTVGGVLLGTSVVCLVALWTRGEASTPTGRAASGLR